MRILLFVSDYPPYGTTNAIHYFAKEWVKDGNEVQVIYDCSRLIFPLYFFAGQTERRQSAGKIEHYDLDGVHVLKLPIIRLLPRKRHISFTSKKRAVKELRKYLLDKGQFDIIISHFCSNHFYLVQSIRDIVSCPIMSVFHTVDTQDVVLARKIIESSNIVGARSAKIKDYLNSEVGYQGKIEMIFSGIPEEYIYFRNNAKKDTCLKLLYVGKLIKRKCVADIIDAVARLSKDIKFSLDIIGDGLERENLEKKVNAYSLETSVFFHGNLPRDNVVDYMRKSDCFIMVSKNETFGLVYLEAMASGCIVVGSRGEGIDGIIKDGINGFLVEPGDSIELTNVLTVLANMKEKETERMLDSSYKTIKKLTDERVANEYLDIIRNDL